MVDSVDRETRSRIMGRVKGKDTRPEMTVRRLAHGAGYRYRLHSKKLPGKPDLVFKGRKKVIFVHGCFWHRHEGCAMARLPKSRLDFWLPKLEANRERDRRNEESLREMGWDVLVIWECEIRDKNTLLKRIRAFLD
ncbi:MAG: DNA mismatch endonuclease Vsr [Halomonas sp.]|nr:very short patch repair endonuclease [Halomonas sp.]MCC5881910.1 DNA mismatch endonuclease Vsr [Halomonas sp.]